MLFGKIPVKPHLCKQGLPLSSFFLGGFLDSEDIKGGVQAERHLFVETDVSRTEM